MGLLYENVCCIRIAKIPVDGESLVILSTLFLIPLLILCITVWIFLEINCFNYGKWLEWLLCEERIKTLGRFSVERGHKEGTWWRYTNNELPIQKVNLVLSLILSYNTRTRGLIMKLKGSKIKTIKENKYLHKCIINLWN